MEMSGYIASVLIGISLGLIGGGGSILTVPVLVYLFGLNALAATEYSLFIVGISSLAGSVSYLKKGWANLRTAFVFGIPSVISIFITRNYILPQIPNEVFFAGNLTVTKDILLLSIFAALMILASWKMIRKAKEDPAETGNDQKFDTMMIAGQGLMVGILTGLVGAGGGFMIIPALVNLLKTPMKVAIGTSLIIISFNSLIGFFSTMHHAAMDWKLLSTISSIAVFGIIIGSQLSKSIDGKKLKPAFGWFTLVMGIYIIVRELIF
ncbi:sulfite exporter TauE/SafE family protein [uncultured Chryseobacterium sp.]|uniref:sulfite exporter TauE/SafE family protein n=1 Tax=uncultured Chryseobacterium sp. TaxID=259322 RepID=UPI0025E78970|nr:sulfite exporter TauE/SafE family protein [uncultured Chryseobacterium sp.]